MDFDEYEYLEKSVEDPDSSSKKDADRKSRDDGSGKAERSYRKRDEDGEDGRESKHSRRDGDDKSSRDRDRHRRDRDKEKGRGGDRDRDRERRDRDNEGEKKREEGERERRSSSRKREERQKELIREGERELEIRDNRRYKDKKEVVEPEADPERDQRTVFAYQITLKATERDVYDFFSKAGKVRDVRLIMDRNSRRSRGVGYIEFYDAMFVPMAIALSGQPLLGVPVMVKPSEAEKNLVQPTAAGSGAGGITGPYGTVDRKLYVGNLHFSITETQLREIFEAFGPVELVQMPTDLETGQCKGFGFVQFSHLEHAKAAQTLNGKLEIAGRVVKVSSVSDHVGVLETGGKSADFDDDEDGGGWSLNAQSRALLMQKLDRTGTATSIAGSLGVPALNGAAPSQPSLSLPTNGQTAFPLPVLPTQVLPTGVSEPIGNPSECLLLKNMFDPATEEEPDFDMDIKDDVGEECSKYGRVKHIYVDKDSAGFVYVRFETVEASMAAQQAMHLRWFARRLIVALFMPPHDYEAKFNSGA